MPDGGGSLQSLAIQSWVMYGIGIFLFIGRVYSRIKRVGYKWKLDDFLMPTAVAWYTAFVITNIRIARGGGSSLYLPDQFKYFTPNEIEDRVNGSKIELASEQCMLNVVYTIKACMLFMYIHLTNNLSQQRFLKICAAYTFCGWVATQLVFFLNCHPFSGYWAIPPPQQECATYFRYLVVQAVFNISSDIAILSIVMPMFFRLNMPSKDKIPLVIIFSMGFFVVISAIVSKIFTFRDVYDTSYQFWYLREASVALYVSNLPQIWGLVRQTFPGLRIASVTTVGNDYLTARSHHGPSETSHGRALRDTSSTAVIAGSPNISLVEASFSGGRRDSMKLDLLKDCENVAVVR